MGQCPVSRVVWRSAANTDNLVSVARVHEPFTHIHHSVLYQHVQPPTRHLWCGEPLSAH